MADEADLAHEVEQQAITSAINALQKQKPQLHPIGVCHYCDAVVGEKQLFCDHDCADDWEKIQQQQRRLGR